MHINFFFTTKVVQAYNLHRSFCIVELNKKIKKKNNNSNNNNNTVAPLKQNLFFKVYFT